MPPMPATSFTAGASNPTIFATSSRSRMSTGRWWGARASRSGASSTSCREAGRPSYNGCFASRIGEMMYYLVAALYVMVCLVLVLVVLLQQGKGGDIASAFGGGSSQAAFGARSGATVLSRATTVAAILFMVGALTLGIIGRRGPSSVLGGRSPLAQPSTPNTTSP